MLPENGRKQPWYITRKDREPIFMAAITNYKPFVHHIEIFRFFVCAMNPIRPSPAKSRP
jgi:putative SOS response-associated peptidase YedK